LRCGTDDLHDEPSISLKRNEKTGVVTAAIITGALVGLSRVTGVIRDIGRTALFGRDWRTDAYVSAFSLPDLVYLLASGGALLSGFIPVFSSYLAKGEDEKAIKTFNVLMTYIAMFLTAVIIACEFLAPAIVALLFPGMVSDEKKLALTITLVRILLPAQFFFALGALFSGALMSLGCFAEPPVQSILYNIGILIGGIVGSSIGSNWRGGGVEGMAVGALIGAAIGTIGVQWVRLWRLGMNFMPCFDWRDEGAREVVRLILPVMLSLSVTYINSTILPRSFSSLLPHGAATSVEMANRVMQLPVALFGASIGIALFPTLSTLAAKEDIEAMREQAIAGLKAIILLATLSATLIGVLRSEIITLLFQYGRWTAHDTQATALALLFYSIGVPAMSCQNVLARVFYALHDTRTPVLVALCSFAIAMAVSGMLVHSQLQHGGLALASSVSAWFNMLMLLLLMSRRVGSVNWAELGRFCSWVAVGAIFAGLCAHMCAMAFHAQMSLGLLWRILAVFMPSLVGTGAFLLVAFLGRLEEVEVMMRKLLGLIRRRQR
jgi:putative peptidoglycan lipid II flippase